MLRVGARELKQHTGEIIARLRRGERILLTLRGAPIAVIAPIDQTALEGIIDQTVQSAENLGWLAASKEAFDFWDNEDDAVWDNVVSE
jgi:prevent-host-death family protein